jgi:protein arginine N-methyltransferase 1
MYSVADYGTMILDGVRMHAHAEALRRVVTPTSIVLDVGAGTGIMSLLACKLGARRVYAVEPAAAVQILVEAARDNGFSDRVVVLQQPSTEVTLPERADVMVSDLRGILPPHQTHFADIIDARARLLTPDARLLPETDTLWLGVVSAPDAFERRRRPWLDDPHGVVLRSALRIVDSSPVKHRARPDELLGPPARWARLHYPTMTALGLHGSGTSTVARPGTAHGLLVWFETVLVEGVGYSNAPDAPEGIYGQMLFPWPEAVPLDEGDTVAFDIRADPVGGSYLWTWASAIRRRAGSAAAPASFRQSTFQGLLASPGSLRRRAGSFTTALSPAGARALEVLEGMRAGRTVGDIAGALRAAHPEAFRSLDEAHGFVAELVERHGL